MVARATVAPPPSASSLSVEMASKPMKLNAATGTADATRAHEESAEGTRTSNERCALPVKISRVAEPTKAARTVSWMHRKILFIRAVTLTPMMLMKAVAVTNRTTQAQPGTLVTSE